MRGGRREGVTRIGNGEANGVMNCASGDFIVANEPREDGKACGVGAGPGIGALLVGEQIPDGSGAGVPGSGLRIRAVEFVEETSGGVEDEDVAITGTGIGVALDGRGERDGHGTGVALAAVRGVIDGDERLRGIDHRVGDADGGALILPSAEIGVQADGCADEVDYVGGVGINGSGGNVFVPEIVGRKRNEAV